MSQENLEIIRGFDADYRRRDLEAIYERYHPDIEVRDWMGGVHKGREAATDSMKEWLRQWEWFSSDLEEIVELPGDRAVVINRFRGKGKQSGAETEWVAGEIWTFREGKIAQIVDYPDVDAAFKAAGL